MVFINIHFVKSQVFINGKVMKDQNRISNATILIFNDKDQIIEYTQSNEVGEYKFKKIINAYKLTVSHISFESKTIILESKNYENLIIQLNLRNTQLPRVIVKNVKTLITQKNDTISYDIELLKNSKDRVLKDMLEKLPGITVSSNGTILYQNKAINKFYIDGNDILDDRYNLASNNLPIDAIDKIQVLENHQPIKMFDNIIFSDRAGLNIKLKQNAKNKILGRGIANTGAYPNLLYDEQISLFSFKGKLKMVNSTKLNNIGSLLEDEIISLNNDNTLQLLESNSIKQSHVDLIDIQPPKIKKNRYSFNQDILQSTIFSINLSTKLKLKLFAASLFTRNSMENLNINSYYFPNDTFSIKENIKNKRCSNNYFLTGTINKNTKNVYTNNIFNFKYSSTNDNGKVEKLDTVLEKLNQPFFNINNNFQLLKKIKNNYFSINSFLSYTKERQALQIQKGVFENLLNNNNSYNSITQFFINNTIYVNNYISTTFKIKKVNLSSKLGIIFHKQNIQCFLEKSTSNIERLASPFITNSRFMNFNPYLENGVLYNHGKINFDISSNINSQNIRYDTINSFGKINNSRLFANYSSSIRYKFSKKIAISANHQKNNYTSTIIDNKNGYFLENYRTIYRTGNNPLEETTNSIQSISLNYKNILKSFFANFIYSNNKTSSNLLYNTIVENNYLIRVGLLINNNRLMKSINLNVSKYFDILKSSLSSNITFQSSNITIFQQNEKRELENNSFIFNLKGQANITKTTFLNYLIDYKTNSNFETNQKKNIASYKSLSQTIKFDKQIKSLLIGFCLEHLYNNKPSKQNNYFVDVNLNRKLTKRNIDINLNFLNLFNNQNYNINIFQESNFQTTKLYLRPFSIMGGVKFSF